MKTKYIYGLNQVENEIRYKGYNSLVNSVHGSHIIDYYLASWVSTYFSEAIIYPNIISEEWVYE